MGGEGRGGGKGEGRKRRGWEREEEEEEEENGLRSKTYCHLKLSIVAIQHPCLSTQGVVSHWHEFPRERVTSPIKIRVHRLNPFSKGLPVNQLH